ncbi:GIY-YIG nuclease family protein [Brevundimonas sp. NPDC046655]|uniref:GIY-YIG nuclease family protein n=1 Tax=unclassified Brevundimonas TaxID=2622653 RepID=UPI00384BDFA5
MRDDGTEGFWIYIVANHRNGAIYTGHTENLGRRAHEHASGLMPGFTRDHGCKTLVWAEWHETRESAFRRERAIKEWRRAWKLRLIEERNPTWRDMLADYVT